MSTYKFKICYIFKKCFGISLWRFYFKSYLKDLKNITQKEKTIIEKEEKSKQVWTMWLQEEIPETCQMCINIIKSYYPNTIVITEKNIKNFINIPEIIWQKYKQKKIIPALFSDYIRMCLLDKYGGLWIDSTCFLTQKIPKYIWKSPFFVMKENRKFGFSNYFIYSDPNNYLTKMIKNFLEQFWIKEDKEPCYFFYHYFVRILIENDKKAKECWDNIPIGLNLNTKLLRKILFNDYDEDIFNWLKNTSFMHKLTYKSISEDDKNTKSYYRYIMNEFFEKTIPQNNFSNQQ